MPKTFEQRLHAQHRILLFPLQTMHNSNLTEKKKKKNETATSRSSNSSNISVRSQNPRGVICQDELKQRTSSGYDLDCNYKGTHCSIWRNIPFTRLFSFCLIGDKLRLRSGPVLVPLLNSEFLALPNRRITTCVFLHTNFFF